MSTRIVIACYKPIAGKQEALESLVESHVQSLRDEGLVTDRQPIILKAKDGTITEIFEWKSKEAIELAHENPRVQQIWQQFANVCAYVPIGDLAEAAEIFPDFMPLN